MNVDTDSIVAVATPSGEGGIGVVRVSGSLVPEVVKKLLHRESLLPRYAHHLTFYNAEGQALDEGLALYFQSPHSYTGEDVLELQAHGSPAVLQALLVSAASIPGVRMARPGEFTERAFLNGKMDLAQAEAVADVISARSEEAARAAFRSLRGDFSKTIHGLVEAVTKLRLFVEANIDFVEEDIEQASDVFFKNQLQDVQEQIHQLLASSKRGARLSRGEEWVLAGKPNAGKSSVFNVFVQYEAAIVTEQAGTTRDVLKETLLWHGVPIQVFDTAGIRWTQELVEQEGVKRSLAKVAEADVVFLVYDASTHESPNFLAMQEEAKSLGLVYESPHAWVWLRNKIDVVGEQAFCERLEDGSTHIGFSAKTGEGMDHIMAWAKDRFGLLAGSEDVVLARERHLEALLQARDSLEAANHAWLARSGLEWVAEDLRRAQEALGSITGKVSVEDLLGQIFSQFCIGK